MLYGIYVVRILTLGIIYAYLNHALLIIVYKVDIHIVSHASRHTRRIKTPWKNA